MRRGSWPRNLSIVIALHLWVGSAGCDWLQQTSDDASVEGGARARDGGPMDEDAASGGDAMGSGDARPGGDPDLDFGVPERGSEEVAPGDTTMVGPVTVTADPGALARPITIDAVVAELPAPLPDGAALASHVVDITVSDRDAILAPLRVQLHYDPASLGGDEEIAVLHYDETRGYETLEIAEVDAESGLVTVLTRAFSHFAPIRRGPFPASHLTEFNYLSDGWPIPNVGSGPNGGACLGMVSFAAWYNRALPDGDPLRGFPHDIATVLAVRAQLYALAVWNEYRAETRGGRFTAPATLRLARSALVEGPTPLVISGTLVRPDGSEDPSAHGTHAILLTGYDEQYFYGWDPNNQDDTIRIAYTDAGAFGPDIVTEAGSRVVYRVGPISDTIADPDIRVAPLPSVGEHEDFSSLLQDALAAFPDNAPLTTTAPDGFAFEDRVVEVIADYTAPLSADAAAYVITGGIVTPLSLSGTRARGVVPAFAGMQTLHVMVAPSSAPTLLAANTAVDSVTFESTVAPSKLVAILSWTGDADVDLYMVAPDRSAIWLNEQSGPAGTLGLSSGDGSLPEYIVVADGEEMPGPYLIRAHLYSDNRGDGAPPVSVTAHLHIDEGFGSYTRCQLELPTADFANIDPTDTGPDWVDIALVELSATGGVIHPILGEGGVTTCF